MAAWEIQPLRGFHERAKFDCGHPSLNEWLQQRAGQWDRKELSRCYVAVRPGGSQVLGYYAISSHHVSFQALPDDQAKGLPNIDIPVVLLGRLAVDLSEQGQGLGRCLLVDALQRAERLASELGVRAVEVEAMDEAAREFYSKFGFVPLADDPRHLVLPMHVIRKLPQATRCAVCANRVFLHSFTASSSSIPGRCGTLDGSFFQPKRCSNSAGVSIVCEPSSSSR